MDGSNPVIDAVVTIAMLPACLGVAILLQWAVLKTLLSFVQPAREAVQRRPGD